MPVRISFAVVLIYFKQSGLSACVAVIVLMMNTTGFLIIFIKIMIIVQIMFWLIKFCVDIKI